MNRHVASVMCKRALLCAVLALSASSCTPPIGTCPPEYRPLHIISMPQSPDEEGNAFSAEVRIGFFVDEGGRVRSPEILSELWRRDGQLESAPKGYNEALIATVEQLRYPTRRKACRTSVRLTGNVFSMGADQVSASGKRRSTE